jgi:hypothetical protein
LSSCRRYIFYSVLPEIYLTRNITATIEEGARQKRQRNDYRLYITTGKVNIRVKKKEQEGKIYEGKKKIKGNEE